MLPWSLAIFSLAAVMLLMVNLRMRGNIDYVIAALWALIAVYVQAIRPRPARRADRGMGVN